MFLNLNLATQSQASRVG